MIDSHTVTNISLASALLTMGVNLKECPHRIKTERNGIPVETLVFTFSESGGQYAASELIKAWFDDDFSTQNPEHPFVYIREAFKTRKHILDNIKEFKRTVIIQKGRKIAIIPDGAPNAEDILGRL